MQQPALSQKMSLNQTTNALWVEGQYQQLAEIYEQLVAEDPAQSGYYWSLGLAYLLLGQEEEAQLTWSMALVEAAENADVSELANLLVAEAQRLQNLNQLHSAWLIRQHLQSIGGEGIENLLHLVKLSLQLDRFDVEDFQFPDLLERVSSASSLDFGDAELLELLDLLLSRRWPHPDYLAFAQACAVHLQDHSMAIEQLMQQAHHWRYVVRDFELACQFAEVCLQLDPNNGGILGFLALCYRFLDRHEEAIALAKRCYNEFCQSVSERLAGNTLLLHATITAGGKWPEAAFLQERQRSLLEQLVQELDAGEEIPLNMRNLGCFFHFSYFEDQPQIIRPLQNQFAQYCYQQTQDSLKQSSGGNSPFYAARSRLPHLKKLRIGYLSRNFRRHSIGWLARWLLKYHDLDRIESYVYFLSQSQPCSFGEEWYVKPATRATCIQGTPEGIAQLIYNDEIDILIDLESISSEESVEIMALKPAPVQVTWLGLDASSNPAIDYFMADPYVLPDAAQDYYHEKIWRLPQTYLAVDGFEVGVPTLRRDRLTIPQDAVVFFSSQTAMKRHPETARLQMQIIRSVPNSYFLIKGSGNQNTLRAFFEQIAEEEGVAVDRLRFLPMEAQEETHRANLGIADVVLDTFPYNGATTTLETLWMGIPLVTQVGQQFAARNSYTMLMNVGISEGIAWTAEEYVEWGIRLGQDAALRTQISRKLKQSRSKMPLWDSVTFARNMEAAYAQMWQIHLDS